MAKPIRSHLPQELQEKILLLLPIKSIVRFESVAKSWQSTFHSRHFIASFGPRYPDLDPRTIRHSPDIFEMVPELDEDESGWRPKTRVLGPLSNGIYCLTSHCHYKKSRKEEDYRGFFSSAAVRSTKIALCNPATRHYKFIDPFPVEFHTLLSQVASNSKPCRVHFGFGCVENNNSIKSSHVESYNVVVLVNYDGDGRARLQEPPYQLLSRPAFSSFLVFVYKYKVQSGCGKWKKIVDYDPGKRNIGRRKAIEAFNGSIQGRKITDLVEPFEACPQKYFKGCFHWMAVSENRSCVVLSYNFVDESFKLIGAPQHPNYDWQEAPKKNEVFVLHDHLAVIKILQEWHSRCFAWRCYEVDVWMMMEYGIEESWTRIYTIHPDNLYVDIRKFYGIDYCSEPSEIGGIRIKRIFFQDGNKDQIISYNEGGGEHKVVGSSKYVSDYCWNTSGISTYVETLEHF